MKVRCGIDPSKLLPDNVKEIREFIETKQEGIVPVTQLRFLYPENGKDGKIRVEHDDALCNPSIDN